MALRDPLPGSDPVGAEYPRLAPPVPLRSLADDYVKQAIEIGITPFPWERVAYHYITALDADNRWLYPENADIVSRQNGKSLLLVPLIVKRLREGRRIMHTAQNRNLPRIVFEMVADVMQTHYLRELAAKPRFANGQEEIRTRNGGYYRIVAPTRGGARGLSCDDVIIDELREMNDTDFISAAEPALAASDNPQVIYVSNAGTDDSIVLNSLRDRAHDDPKLAYLEWSAAPDRDADDRAGWLEANPSVGHLPGLWSYLERKHESYRLAGMMGIFETEHLCRWVNTILPPIISRATWDELGGSAGAPIRPAMGISLDPSGQRASAVIAWQMEDGRVAVRPIREATGEPNIEMADFGGDLKRLQHEHKVKRAGYDGATDRELSKFLKEPDAITGAKFTNASSLFVNLVETHKLVIDDPDDVIGACIEWTGRKTHEQPGTWTAIPLSAEHPVTALLATIRAVSLAFGPKPTKARVH